MLILLSSLNASESEEEIIIFFLGLSVIFFFKEKVKLCHSRLKELLTTNSSSDEVVRSATQVKCDNLIFLRVVIKVQHRLP